MTTSQTPSEGSVGSLDLVGTVFADRYLVTQSRSSGANTAIFHATDQTNGRGVTLKLLTTSAVSSPTFRQRFDEAMRASAALSHPNIAAVFDWGFGRVGLRSTAYVVSEELGGGSLRDMLDRGRRLTPSQALVVGLDACRALDYAHRRGLIHSELTPAKLVFGDDRRLRLVDFGLARVLGEVVWEHPDAVPTHVAWYASPEQGLQMPIDGTTDVYALCLGLHEAVTGFLPFKDDSTVASLSARVGKLMPVSADLGPLAAVFERAGRPEGSDRATAAQFGKALLGVAALLPRPEPLPLLSSGLFDTPPERLRDPDDPTGGVQRPGTDTAPGNVPVLVVPVDEPNTTPEAVDGAGADVDAPTGQDTTGQDTTGEDTTGEDIGDENNGDENNGDDISGVVDSAQPLGGDLVILPLDSGITDAVAPPGGHGEPAIHGDHYDAADEVSHRRPAAQTQLIPVQIEHAPRRHRGAPWKLLTALLVMAALGALGVLATQLFKTPVYAVPDLRGMPVAEARNLVAANGWETAIERVRSDEYPVVDQVVRTAPQAGADLAEGEPFLLVVSDGPTLRELPESTGVPLADAQNALTSRGLEVMTVEQFDEVVPVGTVISWSVPGEPTLVAGTQVEPETPVELVVSSGPAPRTTPDVRGLPADMARTTIEDLGLVYVEAGQQFSDDTSLGSVISQTVEPGTEVDRGTTVAVVVSLGPDLVRFPDLSGIANYEEAAQVLAEAGFQSVLEFGDAQGQIRSILIDGSEPTVGTTYRRGTTVVFQAFDNS